VLTRRTASGKMDSDEDIYRQYAERGMRYTSDFRRGVNWSFSGGLKTIRREDTLLRRLPTSMNDGVPISFVTRGSMSSGNITCALTSRRPTCESMSTTSMNVSGGVPLNYTTCGTYPSTSINVAGGVSLSDITCGSMSSGTLISSGIFASAATASRPTKNRWMSSQTISSAATACGPSSYTDGAGGSSIQNERRWQDSPEASASDASESNASGKACDDASESNASGKACDDDDFKPDNRKHVVPALSSSRKQLSDLNERIRVLEAKNSKLTDEKDELRLRCKAVLMREGRARQKILFMSLLSSRLYAKTAADAHQLFIDFIASLQCSTDPMKLKTCHSFIKYHLGLCDSKMLEAFVTRHGIPPPTLLIILFMHIFRPWSRPLQSWRSVIKQLTYLGNKRDAEGYMYSEVQQLSPDPEAVCKQLRAPNATFTHAHVLNMCITWLAQLGVPYEVTWKSCPAPPACSNTACGSSIKNEETSSNITLESGASSTLDAGAGSSIQSDATSSNITFESGASETMDAGAGSSIKSDATSSKIVFESMSSGSSATLDDGANFLDELVNLGNAFSKRELDQRNVETDVVEGQAMRLRIGNTPYGHFTAEADLRIVTGLVNTGFKVNDIRTMDESIDFIRHRRPMGEELRRAASILPSVTTKERQTRLVNVGMYKRMEEMITDPAYDVYFNCEFDSTDVFLKRAKAFLVVVHCSFYKKSVTCAADFAFEKTFLLPIQFAAGKSGEQVKALVESALTSMRLDMLKETAQTSDGAGDCIKRFFLQKYDNPMLVFIMCALHRLDNCYKQVQTGMMAKFNKMTNLVSAALNVHSIYSRLKRVLAMTFFIPDKQNSELRMFTRVAMTRWHQRQRCEWELDHILWMFFDFKFLNSLDEDVKTYLMVPDINTERISSYFQKLRDSHAGSLASGNVAKAESAVLHLTDRILKEGCWKAAYVASNSAPPTNDDDIEISDDENIDNLPGETFLCDLRKAVDVDELIVDNSGSKRKRPQEKGTDGARKRGRPPKRSNISTESKAAVSDIHVQSEVAVEELESGQNPDTIEVQDGLSWKNKTVKYCYYCMREPEYIIRRVISMNVGELMTSVMHWVKGNLVEMACGGIEEKVIPHFKAMKNLDVIESMFSPVMPVLEHLNCNRNMDWIFDFCCQYVSAMEAELKKRFFDYDCPPIRFAALLGVFKPGREFRILRSIFRNKDWKANQRRVLMKHVDIEDVANLRTDTHNKEDAHRLIEMFEKFDATIQSIKKENIELRAKGQKEKRIPLEALPWNDPFTRTLCEESVRSDPVEARILAIAVHESSFEASSSSKAGTDDGGDASDGNTLCEASKDDGGDASDGKVGTLFRKYARHGKYSSRDKNDLFDLRLEHPSFIRLLRVLRRLERARNTSECTESKHWSLQKSVVHGYHSNLGLAMARVGLCENKKDVLIDSKMKASYIAFKDDVCKRGNGGVAKAIQSFENKYLNIDMIQLAEEQLFLEKSNLKEKETLIDKAHREGIFLPCPGMFLDDGVYKHCKLPLHRITEAVVNRDGWYLHLPDLPDEQCYLFKVVGVSGSNPTIPIRRVRKFPQSGTSSLALSMLTSVISEGETLSLNASDLTFDTTVEWKVKYPERIAVLSPRVLAVRIDEETSQVAAIETLIAARCSQLPVTKDTIAEYKDYLGRPRKGVVPHPYSHVTSQELKWRVIAAYTPDWYTSQDLYIDVAAVKPINVSIWTNKVDSLALLLNLPEKCVQESKGVDAPKRKRVHPKKKAASKPNGVVGRRRRRKDKVSDGEEDEDKDEADDDQWEDESVDASKRASRRRVHPKKKAASKPNSVVGRRRRRTDEVTDDEEDEDKEKADDDHSEDESVDASKLASRRRVLPKRKAASKPNGVVGRRRRRKDEVTDDEEDEDKDGADDDQSEDESVDDQYEDSSDDDIDEDESDDNTDGDDSDGVLKDEAEDINLDDSENAHAKPTQRMVRSGAKTKAAKTKDVRQQKNNVAQKKNQRNQRSHSKDVEKSKKKKATADDGFSGKIAHGHSKVPLLVDDDGDDAKIAAEVTQITMSLINEIDGDCGDSDVNVVYDSDEGNNMSVSVIARSAEGKDVTYDTFIHTEFDEIKVESSGMTTVYKKGDVCLMRSDKPVAEGKCPSVVDGTLRYILIERFFRVRNSLNFCLSFRYIETIHNAYKLETYSNVTSAIIGIYATAGNDTGAYKFDGIRSNPRLFSVERLDQKILVFRNQTELNMYTADLPRWKKIGQRCWLVVDPSLGYSINYHMRESTVSINGLNI
jgi:hypothetical protein